MQHCPARAAQRRGRIKLLALFYVADGACVKFCATQTLGFDIFRKNRLLFLFNLHTYLPSLAGKFAVFPTFFPRHGVRRACSAQFPQTFCMDFRKKPENFFLS